MHDTAPLDPYLLRLVVHRRGDAYTARFIEPDGQETEPVPLTLPLDEDARDDLSWYLDDYADFVGVGDRVRAAKLEQQIDDWGRDLYEALFENPEGARVHMRLMDAARAGRPASLTVGTNEPEVHVQPWEMMRDRRGPLVFQDVTIRRQQLGADAARRFKLRLPLRVLLITSRPHDAKFIDPRISVVPVLDALENLGGQVDVDYCEPPTFARLERMISEARKKDRPFHIVHFDGHGTYSPDTGTGALAFERDETGQETHPVAGRVLGDLLSRLDVPLVLLEACRSSSLSNQPILGSVAPALLRSGVGSVLAFSHSIHVEASRLLVERFYQELVDGLTIGKALEEARTGLRAQPSRPLAPGPNPETVDLQDWFVPQLYQVGDDLALVSPDGNRPARAPKPRRRRSASLPGFPPPPMYHFHGRHRELLELERAFRVEPAVVLTGMGGMGKTALAREAADWWLRKKRFEAAVFHSFEQKAGADRVVQVLGTALEGDGFSSRPAQRQWDAAIDLFHERRVLFVWDNFESTLPAFQNHHGQKGDDGDDAPLQFDAEKRRQLQKLFRELTEDDPKGRLLVTCRPQATGLPGIKESQLSGLARPDSLHLLTAVLGKKGVSTDRKGCEREEVDKLLHVVDNHPLSISLVVPHLETLTPSQIVDELRNDLERFADDTEDEACNRSLLASLAFSTRRLSEAAQDVLPYLAWFEGGVFEHVLLHFTQLDADAWEAIRGELVATALIRVEEIAGFNTPFFRFHPTLPYATRPEDVADVEDVETRFIAVYVTVGEVLDKALFGSQPAAGMALLSLEEANFRSALRRAFRRGARQEGARMAFTLGEYLKRAGRVRERDDFVAWVRSQLPEDVRLDQATWGAGLQHAMGLLSQGKADEAVATVRGLIARLEAEGLAGGEDPAFQVATSYSRLGQIYKNAHRPGLALEPTQRAIALLEELSGDVVKGNLAATLGDLANALRALGRFDEAKAVAERALAIARELGDERSIAAGLCQIAKILSSQQRYAEAGVRYGEALDASRSAGDLGLQGTTLQHQAIMQSEMGNPGRAVEVFKKALVLFEKAGDAEGQIQICDSLGSVEMLLGHLDAAEAWYTRSRELAEKRTDRYHLAVTAQNVGILHQTRADQAEEDEVRGVHLRRAVVSIEEGLAIRLEMEDQVGVAGSYYQLGVLHRMLGELDRAEEFARQSMGIRESLNLPEVFNDYGNLALVARDRGDAKAAAEWQAKYKAKLAEVERLRRGDGPAQRVQAVLALARAVHEARLRGVALPVEAAEALAQLSGLPAPLGDVGDFLRGVADGGTPAVPSDLPSEIGEVLEGLVGALG